jgi:hypothetical protein
MKKFKKLQLSKETLKSLKVKSAVKTGRPPATGPCTDDQVCSVYNMGC